jgi:hypothetical protein
MRNYGLRGSAALTYAIPFYPQKLALILPTSRGCSIGIVRSRTKGTELLLVCICNSKSSVGQWVSRETAQLPTSQRKHIKSCRRDFSSSHVAFDLYSNCMLTTCNGRRSVKFMGLSVTAPFSALKLHFISLRKWTKKNVRIWGTEHQHVRVRVIHESRRVLRCVKDKSTWPVILCGSYCHL